MKITVTNYIYPIRFSYKGWYVLLNKKIGLFSTVSVEAIFTPQNLRDNIKAEQEMIKFALEHIETATWGPSLQKFTMDDYYKYLSISNQYLSAHTSPTAVRKERFSANSLLDNFVGSNTSATKKLLKKVEEYMDANLPTIKEVDSRPYKEYIRSSDIHPTIKRFIEGIY